MKSIWWKIAFLDVTVFTEFVNKKEFCVKNVGANTGPNIYCVTKSIGGTWVLVYFREVRFL